MSFESAYQRIERRRIREGRTSLRLRTGTACRAPATALRPPRRPELLPIVVSSLLFRTSGMVQ